MGGFLHLVLGPCRTCSLPGHSGSKCGRHSEGLAQATVINTAVREPRKSPACPGRETGRAHTQHSDSYRNYSHDLIAEPLTSSYPMNIGFLCLMSSGLYIKNQGKWTRKTVPSAHAWTKSKNSAVFVPWAAVTKYHSSGG